MVYSFKAKQIPFTLIVIILVIKWYSIQIAITIQYLYMICVLTKERITSLTFKQFFYSFCEHFSNSNNKKIK
jgi:hypothetical protein